jgi:hypothetical protein
MAGSARYLSANGVRFGIPADCEPKILVGGRYVSEVVAYGDGLHVDIEQEITGKISDLEVRLATDNGDFERFDALAKTKNLTLIFQGAYETYQGVGRIVAGSEGIQKNAYKDKSETFSVVATRGSFKKIA